MRHLLLVSGWLLINFVLGSSLGRADDFDRLRVGVQPDGRIVVPTNQVLKPAGKLLTFPGRPVDLVLAEHGKLAVVKNLNNLIFIDTASGVVKQALELPGPGKNKPTFSVVGLCVDGDNIYATDSNNQVRVAEKQKNGSYAWGRSVELVRPRVGGAPHPAGLSMVSSQEMWVTATRGNSVQLVDLTTREVEQIVAVGVAPFMVCPASPEKVYVSNWGGDLPGKDDPQAISSDSLIRIDSRTNVANQGSVSVLGRVPGKWKQQKTISVGMHPCAMVLSKDKNLLYIANANSDSVSVIDTHSDEVIETVSCRPLDKLPFGSGSNALALSPEGDTLYVANGTNNCIAVVRLGGKAVNGKTNAEDPHSKLVGLIPTGWYPGAIQVSADGKQLFVANIKGLGSLSQPRAPSKGKTSGDFLGCISIIDVPDKDQLTRYTAEVNQNNRLNYSLAGLEKPRAAAEPRPLPHRHGEPSVFKHVIYIIKENRTYDQVFGDMKEANGDPKLVMFGEETTPNHHALARQFTLFDNFYCSGAVSADGHSWVNEAYVTDYLERAFGGWVRSYPDDGSDPLAYPPTGFLWDNALEHKKTFRNYGEFVKTSYEPKTVTWADFYEDYKQGTHTGKAISAATMKSIEPFTHKGYPWFPLIMPDVYRAKIFIDELKAYEKQGELPNLLYVTLPCDHTTGTRPGYPTPRASVADNDLALGQIVEAVSKSKFWAETCIFVVEDDPQNGFDHVDAHRTVALVVSPYTKRKFVDGTQYNQTGMVKTIELILGLPPMNQLDLSATPMRNCFNEKPDLASYTAVANRIKLDEMNPPMQALNGKKLFWAKKSMELDLDEGDQADEDTLNHILWYATRGYETAYPEKYAGRQVD
ncbi:MAG: bifunctional YncE family protein/alkaline phosphatase family protein [Gemmataceae bacterium]